MRFVALVALGMAVGCRTAPAPAEMTLDECVQRLKAYPRDFHARSAFVILLAEADERTMHSMRIHHGTGEVMMNHYYPSYRWIHPFVRACRHAAWNEFDLAKEQFLLSRNAARNAEPSDLASVVAEEAHLRFKETP